MTVLGDADDVRLGAQPVTAVYAGEVQVWPTGFDPTSLAGLAVWFDASAVGLPDGAPINSAWPGGASSVVGSPAPTMRTNALNGLSVARFKPSEGRIRVTGLGVSTGWTLVYVGRLIGPVAGRVVTAQYPPNNLVLGFWNGNQDAFYDNGFASNTYVPWATGWKLYSGDAHTAPTQQSRIFSDGVLLGTLTTGQGWGGTFNLSGYAGATEEETCDCEVAEVLLYDRQLADTDRQAVESYLRDKWAPA